MGIFTNQDQIIKAVSSDNLGQNYIFQKHVSGGYPNIAKRWYSAWWSPGNPSLGTTPVNGSGGAVVTTSSTNGAIPFYNASGGRSMYLTSIGMSRTYDATGGLIMMVCDRIAHANINNDAAGTTTFSPVLDATSRLDTGEGAQLVLEVTTALSAGANVRTFSYTNQAGTASRTTPNCTMVASTTAGNIPYLDSLFVPLQANDTGVRSVETAVLGSGTATGAYNLVLVRPLATFVLSDGAYWHDINLALDLPNLPQIRDDACLCVYYMGNTASNNRWITGEFRMAEN